MVQRGSISAWVTIDDQVLSEYAEEWDEENDKVTCWIPSEAGKEFQLHLKHENTAYDTSTYFYVDGAFARGLIMRPSVGQYITPPNHAVVCSGVSTSPTTMRPLVFAGLQLSDDDSLLQVNAAPEVGEIRIEHWHVILGQMTTFSGVGFKEVDKVHERSKKAVTHRAGLGTEKVVPVNTFQKATKVTRLLTVAFRYRPLDMLQANGIAPPPTPPPQPIPSASNKRAAPNEDVIDISSDDSEDDIAKLEAKLARLRKKKVKREPGATKVKTEVRPEDIIDICTSYSSNFYEPALILIRIQNASEVLRLCIFGFRYFIQ